MCPLPPEFPAANMRWALDVLSLRRFFSSDPLDTLNQTRVFAVDCETTLTDEELVALHHVGRLTPEGVREFAAERRALLRATAIAAMPESCRFDPPPRTVPDAPLPLQPERSEVGHERPLEPAAVRGAATARNSLQIKGFSKRGK